MKARKFQLSVAEGQTIINTSIDYKSTEMAMENYFRLASFTLPVWISSGEHRNGEETPESLCFWRYVNIAWQLSAPLVYITSLEIINGRYEVGAEIPHPHWPFFN